MYFFNSLLLHVLTVGVFFIAQISFFKKPPQKIEIIPIDIVFEAETAVKTNAPQKTIKTPIKKPTKKKEVVKKAIKEKSSERIVLKDRKKETVKKTTNPVKITKPKPKEQTKKTKPAAKKNLIKKEPKKKAEEFIDLNEIAALIDKHEQKENIKVAENIMNGVKSKSEIEEITASDIAKLRAAMVRCWTPPFGAPNPEKLVVQVKMKFNSSGELTEAPQVLNATQINFSGNRFWKTAERAAVNAAVDCQPYNFLSPYTISQEFILNFDPAEMVGF